MLGSLHFIFGPAKLAARAASVDGRAGEARIGAEAAARPQTARPQTEEDLARTLLQSPLQLHGIVAGIEDEQREPIFHRRSAE